ncbi:MAG TPA: OB-fold nucleic acid binding domain-containing protein, partial [Opitutus sp.]|nr:OB-fold nucleic acid binding domain-containing protein [Opitutus sp.]
LDGIVPLENAAMEGRQVVQWDKDDCEELGLVKVDFLGLGMMAVMQDSFEMCRQRGRPTEMHKVPLDDEETFEMMRRADTIGVFQIESRAQMATLPRFSPKDFYDVAMEVAIVRPGPIAGRLTHPLIRRRAELEKVVYIHPSVEAAVKPILQRTYGVILFQEQMLEIAMVLGDFTGSQAEELRRALGFTKGCDRLKRVIEKLEQSMRAKGLEPDVIAKVLEATTSFAAYGFPESHAISFGLLAYVSTWLKVHRLAEFYASLLNNQPMGFYSPATLIQDGRRHGLKVKSVCVQQSEWKCTVEADDTIRIGLLHVKGLHQTRVEAMLAARAEWRFASLDDFLARTKFTAGERRALASVGALQALASHRRAALWQVEAAWSEEESLFQAFGRGADADVDEGVLAVGGGAASAQPTRTGADFVPLAPMTRNERMQADFQGLQLTVGVHPMTLVRDRLPEVVRAADLALGRDGDRVKVAGSVICRQRPGTAKGFVFVSLEDETGIANAVVTPDLFERQRMVINEEAALYIVGRLQNQDGVIHVKAEKIEALNLAELPEQASHDFR